MTYFSLQGNAKTKTTRGEPIKNFQDKESFCVERSHGGMLGEETFL
jgi:hypothetical protein